MSTGPSGVTGLAARLVKPAHIGEGRLAGLLGALWATGGVWVLLGVAGGLATAGWRAGVVALGTAAVLLGVVLYLVRSRRLPVSGYVALTLLGGVVISLVVLWSGPVGGAVYGVLYIYVSCFSFIALRRQAVGVVVVTSTMHLLALLLSSHPHVLGVWLGTWGAVGVTGLLAGAAVEWLGETLVLVRQADDHKTRFVATVSHELRTPLTAILGATATLQRHWERLDAEQRLDFVRVIDRQAVRQLRLVNDVLAITTQMVEAPTPRPAPMDLEEFLTDTVEALQFPVTVDVPTPLVVLVDRDHLRQVVENLLVNADRYGGQPVVVGGEAVDGRGVIRVVDHGSGLPGGIDGGLLEPFVQGDSGDRRSSAGVGLGLTICRDLVAANLGSLSYADTPGGGATFHVSLPLAR